MIGSKRQPPGSGRIRRPHMGHRNALRCTENATGRNNRDAGNRGDVHLRRSTSEGPYPKRNAHLVTYAAVMTDSSVLCPTLQQGETPEDGRTVLLCDPRASAALLHISRWRSGMLQSDGRPAVGDWQRTLPRRWATQQNCVASPEVETFVGNVCSSTETTQP